jgi:hypothetical protein
MFFQINGLQISTLQKAGDNSAVILVDIIANHLTEDEDDETVLKEAFDAETVKDFLENGVMEYWHESRNPNLSKTEKNEYLIGKPTAFRWENGKPIVTASLTKSHPIVEKMIPHLLANQPVYAASIGGSKMVLEAKDASGQKHRIIPKIKWDHLAIAPAPYVINRAPGMNVRLLQKAKASDSPNLMCEFDNIDTFMRGSGTLIAQEQSLLKALAAPSSVGEMYSTPGGAITKQSLEGNKKLTFDEDESLDLLDTVIGIKNKKIPLQKAEYINHFKKQNKENFGNKSFNLISKYFKKNKERM